MWTRSRNSIFWTSARSSAFALAALSFPLFGCSKIAGWAIDKAIGDDAGLAEQALAGGGTASTKKACSLLTDAEVESASGKKIVKKDDTGGEGNCSWALSATGKEDQATMGNINLQIATELEMKVIPTFGQPKEIPGIGTKAEWVGGMAPNLRVHMSDGHVLNFLFVDPSAMMKNPGITEKKIDNNNSAVNMEYPELEKEAVALGKAAAGRF